MKRFQKTENTNQLQNLYPNRVEKSKIYPFFVGMQKTDDPAKRDTYTNQTQKSHQKII